MNKLTLEQSFDFYIGSLERCGISILNLDDNEIVYQIFEEFNTEIPGSLSPYILDKLELAGVIDSEIKLLSKKLQEKFYQIKKKDLWNVESVKKFDEWRAILQLSDEIKELIYRKWSHKELKYLRGRYSIRDQI